MAGRRPVGVLHTCILCVAITSGSCWGNDYLIADVGTADTLKECITNGFPNLLPESHIQQSTQALQPCRNNLTCRVGNARNKMRPDMMIVEMAGTEQHTYSPHATDTGSRLPNLPATMSNGKVRRVTIVEGGYCSDVS